jgi:hypothetical protein
MFAVAFYNSHISYGSLSKFEVAQLFIVSSVTFFHSEIMLPHFE